LDIGVLGYIGIVQHKEHSPEVLSIPPGTPCICSCASCALQPKLSLVHFNPSGKGALFLVIRFEINSGSKGLSFKMNQNIVLTLLYFFQVLRQLLIHYLYNIFYLEVGVFMI